MRSTLPLDKIQRSLLELGFPVSFSEDPGRYLCNQLFFSALDFTEKLDLGIPVGFIHLPIESDLPTSHAAHAVAEIVRVTDS